MKKISIICFLFFCMYCSKEEVKTTPKKRNITESVYASVTIQPDNLYQVYAAVAGVLENNLVAENDLVVKGTSIAQIINNTPVLNTKNAKLSLAQSKENYNGSTTVLNSINDEIIAAKIKFPAQILKNLLLAYSKKLRQLNLK